MCIVYFPAIRFFAILLMVAWPVFGLAAPVAEISEAKGAVTVLKSGGKRLIISESSTLDVGDIVSTEANSTAVLAFTDGSKFALRPLSRFLIDRYRYVDSSPKEDMGRFSLLKGGLRTLTGAIGRRGDRSVYQVQASTATIGIRGTEYTVRVCESDCGDVQSAQTTGSIRVAGVRGSVHVMDQSGRTRSLVDGAAIKVGDRIDTGPESWVGVVFSDGSKLTLRANSSLHVRDYVFNKGAASGDGFAVSLLKGALRSVTGQVAKRTPQRVKYHTSTATIGIRGTDFSAWCTPSASLEPNEGRVNLDGTSECDQGLLANVTDGRISLGNSAGMTEIGPGESGFVAGPDVSPQILSSEFRFISNDDVPSPGSLPDFDSLPPLVEGGEGVFVLVHDGGVTMTQDGITVQLNKGESAFASGGGGAPSIMESAPLFLSRDPSIRLINLNAFSCSLP